MKTSKYILGTLLAATALGFTACGDDLENPDNVVMNPSLDNVTTILLEGQATATGQLSARLSSPAEAEITFTYAGNPEMVSAYNDLYGTEAIVLPADNYDIPNPTARVAVRGVQSSIVQIDFKGLDQLNDELMYVLPVSIVESALPVLPSSMTTYYVFRGAALINVVAGWTKTCAVFVNEGQCDELSNMEQFSLQVLVNPDEFPNTLATIMGIEGQFLVRVGDAGVPANQIQLATSSGNATDAAWQLDTKKWTAVCLTFDANTGAVNVYFDGVQKGSTQYVSYRRGVNWNVSSIDRACYIGYAYDTDRYFPGYMAELRVWNKVLTAADLADAKSWYRIDPNTEGLVGYWKMNEGGGSLIHDYANGYDMHVPATYPNKTQVPDALQWLPVALPK